MNEILARLSTSIFIAAIAVIAAGPAQSDTTNKDGNAGPIDPIVLSYEFYMAPAGSTKVSISSPNIVHNVGYSTRHLNYSTVECKAWLECSNGKRISCISTGSSCTSSDSNNRVTCTAPGASFTDYCKW